MPFGRCCMAKFEFSCACLPFRTRSVEFVRGCFQRHSFGWARRAVLQRKTVPELTRSGFDGFGGSLIPLIPQGVPYKILLDNRRKRINLYVNVSKNERNSRSFFATIGGRTIAFVHIDTVVSNSNVPLVNFNTE